MAEAKVTTTVTTAVVMDVHCETQQERTILARLALQGPEYTETPEEKLVREEISRAIRAPLTENLTESN